jgi:hypothetical protein
VCKSVSHLPEAESRALVHAIDRSDPLALEFGTFLLTTSHLIKGVPGIRYKGTVRGLLDREVLACREAAEIW